MKKANKKLKGMTLFEIIISIAIFAMLGAVLILVGTHIDRTTKSATSLKNKIVEQSPYAANHITEFNGAVLPTEEINISIGLTGNGNYYVSEDDPDNPGATVVVEKSYNDPTVEMKADKYKTDVIVGEDTLTDDEKNERFNGNLNLEFFEVQTEAP